MKTSLMFGAIAAATLMIVPATALAGGKDRGIRKDCMLTRMMTWTRPAKRKTRVVVTHSRRMDWGLLRSRGRSKGRWR